jgi:hypothetical protein
MKTFRFELARTGQTTFPESLVPETHIGDMPLVDG